MGVGPVQYSQYPPRPMESHLNLVCRPPKSLIKQRRIRLNDLSPNYVTLHYISPVNPTHLSTLWLFSPLPCYLFFICTSSLTLVVAFYSINYSRTLGKGGNALLSLLMRLIKNIWTKVITGINNYEKTVNRKYRQLSLPRFSIFIHDFSLPLQTSWYTFSSSAYMIIRKTWPLICFNIISSFLPSFLPFPSPPSMSAPRWANNGNKGQIRLPSIKETNGNNH